MNKYMIATIMGLALNTQIHSYADFEENNLFDRLNNDDRNTVGKVIADRLNNASQILQNIDECKKNGLKNPRRCAHLGFNLMNKDELKKFTEYEILQEMMYKYGEEIIQGLRSEFPEPAKEDLISFEDLIKLKMDSEGISRSQITPHVEKAAEGSVTPINNVLDIPYKNSEAKAYTLMLLTMGNKYWFYPTEAQKKAIKQAEMITQKIEKLDKLERLSKQE